MKIASLRASAALFGAVFLFTGCSIERAQLAERAKSEMVGLSKTDILTCMGRPDSRSGSEDFEEWVYSHSDSPGIGNTHGRLDEETTTGGGGTTTTARGRYCIVHIRFRRDTVSSVRYSGQTGGIFTRDEQCAFLVSGCLRQNR